MYHVCLDGELTRSHGEGFSVDIIWVGEDVHEEDPGEVLK